MCFLRLVGRLFTVSFLRRSSSEKDVVAIRATTKSLLLLPFNMPIAFRRNAIFLWENVKAFINLYEVHQFNEFDEKINSTSVNQMANKT